MLHEGEGDGDLLLVFNLVDFVAGGEGEAFVRPALLLVSVWFWFGSL